MFLGMQFACNLSNQAQIRSGIGVEQRNPFSLAAYHRDGFASGIEILSPEEGRRHREHLETAERALGHSLHYLNKVHTVLRSPFELATHPMLLDIAEQILGPDILLYNVTYIIKEASTPSFVSWHQDLTYWGFDGDDQVSAWLALSPATVESGCMKMLPGSHLEGERPQETGEDPNNVLLQAQTIMGVDDRSARMCSLEPGQASLHHGWTVHSSGPNEGSDRRIGLNVQYIAPSMRQLKTPGDSAMLVRGNDRFGHFATDQTARDWQLTPEGIETLRRATTSYQAIAGT